MSSSIYPESPNNGKRINRVYQGAKPLLHLSILFGFCQFRTHYTENGIEIKASFWTRLICITVSFLATIYGLFQLTSLAISLWEGVRFLDITIQFLWLNGQSVSIFLGAFMLQRESEVLRLVETWKRSEQRIGHLFSSRSFYKFTFRIFWLFGLMSIVSVAGISFHAFQNPEFPTYPLKYGQFLQDKNGKFPLWIIILQSFLETFLYSYAWCGCVVLELSCCIIAKVIVESLITILDQLNDFYNEGKTGGHPSLAVSSEDFSSHNVVNSQDMQNDDSPNKSSTTNVCPLLKLVQHYQILASFMSDFNSFVGIMLFIDIAQILLMICILIFIPITFHGTLTTDDLVLAVVNIIVVGLRLVILIISLGNVYPAGTEVNLRFSQVMSAFNFENQVLSPVMSSIVVYSSNPICFSAAGFFSVTRGTLLASLSVLSTFLLTFFSK